MKALEDEESVRYFIMGEEKAPTTGHIHYQAYIELNKRFRLKGLKKLLKVKDVHCQASLGTPQQNIDYCSKDGKVTTFGTPAKQTQGARTDVYALYQHFKDGKTEAEALDAGQHIATMARYQKFVNKLQLHFTPARSETTELYIYHGPTHTGKSHAAYEESKEMGEVYFKPVDSNWWDGYHGQPCVIIEDFRGELALSTMLRLADKYPMRVPVKGGYMQFNSKRIYITSNTDIDEWFNTSQKGYDASMAAFKRRITMKKKFNIMYKIPVVKQENQ